MAAGACQYVERKALALRASVRRNRPRRSRNPPKRLMRSPPELRRNPLASRDSGGHPAKQGEEVNIVAVPTMGVVPLHAGVARLALVM